MKKTKDTVTSQLGTTEKTNLIACLATLGITHIAISVPMDTQAVMVANGTTPSPNTMSAETQEWCDLIHAAGLKVIHRGTFCGAENIWNAPYYDGSVTTGTEASASTDGSTTLCGKFYQYLYTNVGTGHVVDGDIFAPVPEGTTHAFDGHYFWTAGSQANYVDVYAKFHAMVTTFGTAAGKSLLFMSHNNYSELASGWIPGSLFSDAAAAGADYYGQYQGTLYNDVSHYISDWNTIYSGKGVVTQWGEWGDLPNSLTTVANLSYENRLDYLRRFYKGIRDSLVDTGKMNFFNYWGGWEGQNTSLLYKTGSGASSQYYLNARGKILQAFFTNQGGIVRSPVITAGTTADTYTF